MIETNSDSILNETEAATLLGVGPRTIRLWRRSRGLPHYKLTAKIVRFKRSDLIEWMESRRRITGLN